ncbi:MAG: GNAT family N-acetyltransferase [Hamadaea sp.]|uniref:GNAT family N-acetyltransferase n=1 Tax=Hamadaea sp. TaxID=2024425 RepID=UPI0017F429C2|nr:GNAT family N-acetyltransferase [Hamadaea sp.]NUR73310.1 GNAT family N-acetyltransferase [Hamadaea sp.]NUT21511.1 GNAT family N-acetyltransferase [Hamadaea sp.]
MADLAITELDDVHRLSDVAELLRRVWAADSADQILNLSTLRALAHAGNYVVGAYRDGQLVGASVAFRGDDHLHSHVTGVVRGGQGAGVGHALKHHQREWSLRHGISRIRWTFDPLVRRNAYFNLRKLGAVATEYLEDFYGALTDGINTGEPSDRLYVCWELDQPTEVPEVAGATRFVPTPPDIEGLRAADPAAAQRWRYAVREGLQEPMATGWTVAGFTEDGAYALKEPE